MSISANKNTSELKKNPLYWEKNPEAKDAVWANNLVAQMRTEWKNIVNVGVANKNMEYLLGTQDLFQIKEGFRKGSKFVRNTKWIPIAVMDRISNILVAEFMKAAHKPAMEASDLSSQIEKKNDKTLLQGRPLLESEMTNLTQRTGNPPFRMPYDNFSGNIEDFDKMGLSEMIPQDVQFFMDNFHKLWHEADAEQLIMSLMKDNEFEVHIQNLVHDILAKMCVTFQVYASPHTGKIVWNYKKPEDIKAIEGNLPNMKDALCIGWEENVSVRQFLDFAGPRFDFNRDKEYLRHSLNFYNKTNYERVDAYGCWEFRETGGKEKELVNVVSYGEMLKHKIGVGYMEWKTIDSVVKKKNRESGLFIDVTGRLKDGTYKRDAFKDDDKYSRDEKEFQKTYKTWYLSTGYNSQYLFRYGPLYHMTSEGTYDEYSNYSINVYRSKGKSAIEIAEPFIDIVNEAFYKILWAIKESTPRKRIYNYDAIVALVAAKKEDTSGMIATGDTAAPRIAAINQVNALLDEFNGSLREMYTSSAPDGTPIKEKPHYWDEGGLDPLAAAMQTVMDWAEAQVSARLGINPIRDAYAPDPKDPFKLNQLAMQQSRNATYYVPYMIGMTIKNSATASLLIAQNAIEFKTKTYDYLETLITEESLWSFRALNKIPFHRYGMYVELFNSEEKKQKINSLAELSLKQGQITPGQLVMIQEMDNHKKAGMMLEHYRIKNQMEAEAGEERKSQRIIAQINAKKAADLEVIDRKGEWDVRREDVRGNYYMRAHQTPAEAAITKKQMDQENNAQKLNERADATIKVKKAEKEMEAAAAPPVPVQSLPEAEAAPSPSV